jgi:Holliday junction resolvase-like predicted endonuclease
MTVADDVLQALRGSAAGLADAELAALLGRRHQQINQTCRHLADQGLVVRDGSRGQIINRLPGESRPAAQLPSAVQMPDQAQDWAWEGNVQGRVVAHLARTGWHVVAVADTARRERGADIIAERDGSRLFVEVKGWPSTTYARGERAGQAKPTQPTLQAAHWFAEGLSTLIRRGAAPGTQLALSLPDKPRYRTLLGEAGWALDRLDITVYLVAADGSVQTREREN